jgi:hypothetical protein
MAGWNGVGHGSAPRQRHGPEREDDDRRTPHTAARAPLPEAAKRSPRWRRLVLRALLAIVSISAPHLPLPTAERSHHTLLIALAVLLFVAGVAHLLRTGAHQVDPDYVRDPQLRQLRRKELRVTACWLPSALALVGIAHAGDSMIAQGASGFAVCLIVYVTGTQIGADAALRQRCTKLSGTTAKVISSAWGTRWRARAHAARGLPGARLLEGVLSSEPPKGSISGYLTYTLSLVFIVGCLYGGVAVAGVAKMIAAPHHHKRDGSTAKPRSRAKPPYRTYAQLCPQHPDPLAIGHWLGELFEHEGAVQAGCGQPATASPGSPGVWVASGLCEGSLRSVAIDAPAHPPTLLYGTPARFAMHQALAGELLYVEAAKIAGGDVDLVVTQAGTYAYARPTPDLSPPRSSARRCSEVGGVPRPFTRLTPAASNVWLSAISRLGWLWPLADAAEGQGYAFLAGETVLAQTSCESEEACKLSIEGESLPITGPTDLTIAGLRSALAAGAGAGAG